MYFDFSPTIAEDDLLTFKVGENGLQLQDLGTQPTYPIQQANRQE